VRAQVESDMRAVQTKANALVDTAKQQASLAITKAKDAVNSAKESVEKGKKESKAAIEAQLNDEITDIKRRRKLVDAKAERQMRRAKGGDDGGESVDAIKKAQATVNNEIDQREDAARSLAQKKSDDFCARLDAHVASIEKVAEVTEAKMNASVQQATDKAQKMISNEEDRGRKSLLKASEDLKDKRAKLEELKKENEDAEARLDDLKSRLNRKLKRVKSKASKLVSGPQVRVKSSFDIASRRVRHMQAEIQKEVSQVRTVEDEFETDEEAERSELGMVESMTSESEEDSMRSAVRQAQNS